MATGEHLYDVMIIGAGVSGTTAALLLHRAEVDVLLLDADAGVPLMPTVDWMSPHAATLLAEAGLTTEDIRAQPITTTTFFSSDFSKSICPAIPTPPAAVVDYSALVNALAAGLSEDGCNRRQDNSRVQEISLGEDVVKARLVDGTVLRARLLVLSTGRDARLVDHTGLSLNRGEAGAWVSEYSTSSPPGTEPGRLDYVLGVGGPAGFGYRITTATNVFVGVCVQGGPQAAARELLQISTFMQAQGLVAEGWREQAKSAEAHWSSAGMALELDTHVAKRALIIGEVGGFVTHYTNEGVYPGMWSGRLAAETLQDAIRSRHPQDKLRDFDSLWRMTMAEHLRSPNADAHSILPLVFSNQQMADKMLECFHLGLNF